jgi:hypothetical protein
MDMKETTIEITVTELKTNLGKYLEEYTAYKAGDTLNSYFFEELDIQVNDIFES